MRDDLQIMIDLETLDLEPTAIVAQLGWAIFRLSGIAVIASGNYHLQLAPQQDKGRTMRCDTILWWLEQDEASRQQMTRKDRYKPKEALEDFRCSLEWSQIKGVWSHGLNFDIPILGSLLRSFEQKEPWHYRTPRDTRTMMALAGIDKIRPTDVKHSAEHDAIAQALTMQDCWQHITRSWEKLA